MANYPLDRSFFERNTKTVARDLLGKFLVRKIGKNILSGMIVETEAYVGPHDLACHASNGKTERTKVMFKPAGIWYVYMIYGMHHCLNIVTETKDYPSAVLIRALEPEKSSPACPRSVAGGFGGVRPKTWRKWERGAEGKAGCVSNLTNGPSKLCRVLKIDKKFNCTSAVAKNSKLYCEDRGIKIPRKKIVKVKRIGVDYAGEWKDKLLRFYIKGNRFVSKV